MRNLSQDGRRPRSLRPVIGVLGGGRPPLEPDVDARCRALGELLATRGCHLLTGGGDGVMAAVTEAFVATPGRTSLALGVLPGDPATGEPPAGYPNPHVELAIRTHLPARGDRGEDPDSRNHLNVLSSDALIALAGGAGTVSEVRLALRYRRPVLAFVDDAEHELPGCPEGVATARSIDEIATWLDRMLEAAQAVD